jgi:hypothetical protein
MAQKIDISNVIKFDETFYNIWVHRLTLIFKAEKLWNIVNGIIQKPIAPIVAQIIVGTPSGALSIKFGIYMRQTTIFSEGIR